MEINKNKLKYKNKKPFISFEINNFLDEKEFKDTIINAPNPENFKKNECIVEENKIALSSQNKLAFDKYFTKNKSMKSFLDFFNQNKVKKFFIKEFKYYFIYYQYQSFMTILTNKEKKHIYVNLKLIVKTFLTLIKSLMIIFNHIDLYARIEYSFIKNEGRIVPHTDSKSKFISLMLYFPKYQINEPEFQKEKKIGTILHDSKNSNFSSTHLKGEKLNNFYKNSKILQQFPFEPFHLFGFMRSPYSWHSLEEINVNNEYQRFSININYIFK
jgi:hypothetical protein